MTGEVDEEEGLVGQADFPKCNRPYMSHSLSHTSLFIFGSETCLVSNPVFFVNDHQRCIFSLSLLSVVYLKPVMMKSSCEFCIGWHSLTFN